MISYKNITLLPMQPLPARHACRVNQALKKKGGHKDRPFPNGLSTWAYMPEPAMPFQEVSMDFTALSGSGT